MNYHNITKDDMLNGDGLRVVLWVSGCTLKCPNCQNPQTHPFDSGILFDDEAEKELFEALDKPWIKGITFSGGHPLESQNVFKVKELIIKIRSKFPDKDIWLYTGYRWEMLQLFSPVAFEVVKLCDVLCDGPFIEELKDNTSNCKWVGSQNQRVIDVQKSLEVGKVVLHES